MRGVRRSISPGERERVTAKMERTMEEKIFIESGSERPPCFAAAKGILGRGERERDGHGFFFFFFYSAWRPLVDRLISVGLKWAYIADLTDLNRSNP